MNEHNIPILNFTDLNSNEHFWMSDLNKALQNHSLWEIPHRNNFYSILFIEDASGTILLDNWKLQINEPKIILIKTNCLNALELPLDSKGTIIAFTEDFFSLRYNNNVLNQFNILQPTAKPFFRLNVEQMSQFNILNGLLEKEYNLHHLETKKVIRSYLNIILFEIDRLYMPLSFQKTLTYKRSKIIEFNQLIDTYFRSEKLPQHYAERLNITANYLNKICKEETGQTAGATIRKRITIEAQRLLSFTNYTMNEISFKLGFETASYFSTFFKTQTKMTPDQFRKSQINAPIHP